MHSPDHPAPATPQLLFQPRFDGRSGALVGAKLYLARPGRPDNVVVQHAAPDDLQPLQAACRLVSGWNATHRQRIVLTVGARLEVLCSPAFAHTLNSVLLESRLEPDCLELNIITEQGEVPDTTAAALKEKRSFYSFRLKILLLPIGVHCIYQTVKRQLKCRFS